MVREGTTSAAEPDESEHDGFHRLAPTLIVMVGLPATGKTTIARRVASERGALRLTPDEWMIPLFNAPDVDGWRDVLEGRFVWLAIEALTCGTDVVLDFGVWSRDERSALRFLAAEVGAACELHYVTADHDEQMRRIRARTTTDPHTAFEISSDELRGFRSTFQEPSATELTSSEIEPAPLGYDSWRSWAAEGWPTSME
jgi:predicted kinase